MKRKDATVYFLRHLRLVIINIINTFPLLIKGVWKYLHKFIKEKIVKGVNLFSS